MANGRGLPSNALALGVALVLLATVAGAGAARATSPPPKSSLLVKLKASAPAPPLPAGTRILGQTLTGVYVVALPPRADVKTWAARIAKLPGVEYAEPNATARVATLPAPNDPYYGSDWGWSAISAVDGWSAYPGSYGGSGGATIAIVDTGIDSSHPDLSGRVRTSAGANCVTASGACAAGSALDDNGHGTHVAGIAGAATNNSVGVAGTAFDAQLIPVKVLDSSGKGSYAAITNGIVWAVQQGARVINLSIQGTTPSQTLCDAVRLATSSGAFVAAAAGNYSSSAPSYPAACPGAIGVAATDSSDAPASFSNYGSPDVFVSAPGASIYSTYLSKSYTTMSGTSMATPFVAGLASQLLGQLPSRTPADVAAVLATTSDKVGSGYGSDPYGTCASCTWSPRYGYGRIDMGRALSAADFALAASPASATTTPGGSATYVVQVTTVNGFAGTVSISVEGLPLGWTASAVPSTVTAPGAASVTVTTSALSAAGTYTLTLKGTAGGLVRTARVTLTLTPLVPVGSGAPAPPSPPTPPLPPTPPVPVGATVPTVPTPPAPAPPAAPADFAVTITPAKQRTLPGVAAGYVVSVSASGTGVGLVDLSVSDLPPGASAIFAPPSTSVPGESTLTVVPALSTPSGSYTFTVTGSSGGVTRSTTAVLTVGL